MVIWKTYKLQIWKTILSNGFATTKDKRQLESVQEGYGCEEKDRCCNFECELCEISPRQYLQITGKKPSNKNIKDLINGLADLNKTLKEDGFIPFEEYEVVKL